jgi:hypothetical protein
MGLHLENFSPGSLKAFLTKLKIIAKRPLFLEVIINARRVRVPAEIQLGLQGR